MCWGIRNLCEACQWSAGTTPKISLNWQTLCRLGIRLDKEALCSHRQSQMCRGLYSTRGLTQGGLSLLVNSPYCDRLCQTCCTYLAVRFFKIRFHETHLHIFFRLTRALGGHWGLQLMRIITPKRPGNSASDIKETITTLHGVSVY